MMTSGQIAAVCPGSGFFLRDGGASSGGKGYSHMGVVVVAVVVVVVLLLLGAQAVAQHTPRSALRTLPQRAALSPGLRNHLPRRWADTARTKEIINPVQSTCM